jgi:hypothetical protein
MTAEQSIGFGQRFSSVEPGEQRLELVLVAITHDARISRYILLESRRFHMKLCQEKKRQLKPVTELQQLGSFIIYL